MKLRKIWVLPLLLTLVCSVGCGGKADLLHGYEKVVSSMGSLARTSEHKLIGTRTCGSDNYTGAYAATCRQARGKDVVFGGCSLQARRLQVTGSVACQSGFVQLIVKNGSDELWLTPDANGNISQELPAGAGTYLHRQRRRLVSFGGICRFFRQRDIMQCLCEMKKSVSSGTVRFLLFHTDDRVSFC